jgi:enoyl-CoA hydratase
MDMILTGRPVDAQEALSMGLANRVVPVGTALDAAIKYAQTISSFPSVCMRTDRISALKQWDVTLDQSLYAEGREGNKPLLHDAVYGAMKFVESKKSEKS